MDSDPSRDNDHAEDDDSRCHRGSDSIAPPLFSRYSSSSELPERRGRPDAAEGASRPVLA